MCKNVTSVCAIVMISCILTPLGAEVTVGLLKKITSNTSIDLLDQNRQVVCKPLGIMSLDEMAKRSESSEKCRSEIQAFYHNHPDAKRFAVLNLHREQAYHYESLKEGCALYANGAESYSEMLLREGLALVKSDFENAEWNMKFQRAQKSAELNKRGLHDTLIKENCIKEE